MALSIRALTIVAALLWGGSFLFFGLVNLAFPTYGAEFLRMASSIDPGFHATRTLGDVIIGTLYALCDGAVTGLLFGWLYNGFAVGWGSAMRHAPVQLRKPA